jgi:hypothetical protein
MGEKIVGFGVNGVLGRETRVAGRAVSGFCETNSRDTRKTGAISSALCARGGFVFAELVEDEGRRKKNRSLSR